MTRILRSCCVQWRLKLEHSWQGAGRRRQKRRRRMRQRRAAGWLPGFCCDAPRRSFAVIRPDGSRRSLTVTDGFPRHTMAAIGNFCPKNIWDKSQFYVPRSKESEKVRTLLLYQFWNLSPWSFLSFWCYGCWGLKLRLFSNTLWPNFFKNSHCGLAICLLVACAELLAKYERTKKKNILWSPQFQSKVCDDKCSDFFYINSRTWTVLNLKTIWFK